MEPVHYVPLNVVPRDGRAAAIREAVDQLVSAHDFNGRVVIDMPLVTFGGNSVRVAVWPQDEGRTFIVSDDGMAFFEIDAAAFSHRTFRAVAGERSKVYGAKFDGHSMLFIEVSTDRLRGAIVAMANLVKDVVDETAERAARERAETIKGEMRDRLVDTFGPGRVHRDVEIIGDSSAVHGVDALVDAEHGPVVFDAFSASGHSINSIFTKFSDISRSEHAPRLVGVTRRLERIGPKLTLVSSVASVIEVDSPRETLLRLAA